MSSERAGFVRFQQGIASDTLARGDHKEARRLLRMLRAVDFARPDLSEAHLGVLRDLRSEPDEIIAAIRKLTEAQRDQSTVLEGRIAAVADQVAQRSTANDATEIFHAVRSLSANASANFLAASRANNNASAWWP